MTTLLEDNSDLYIKGVHMVTYRSHGVYDSAMGLATFAAKALIDHDIADRLQHPLLGTRIRGPGPKLKLPLDQCHTKSMFVESAIDALYFLVQQHKNWKKRLVRTLTAEADRLIVERVLKYAQIAHEFGPRAVREGDVFALAPIDASVLSRVFFVTMSDLGVVLTTAMSGPDGWVLLGAPHVTATGDTGSLFVPGTRVSFAYLGCHVDALRRVRPAST